MRKFLIVAASAVALASCGARHDAIQACYQQYPPNNDADGLVLFGAIGGLIAGTINNANDGNKEARNACVTAAQHAYTWDAPSVPQPVQN